MENREDTLFAPDEAPASAPPPAPEVTTAPAVAEAPEGPDPSDPFTWFDAWQELANRPPVAITLADKYGVPPFSVLDARQGPWQRRKREWINGLGIRSELGRDDTCLFASGALTDDPSMNHYRNKNKGATGSAAGLTFGAFNADISAPKCGTSIFDPVLCELLVRWFTPPGGRILDPFAGGSVRGIVSAALGRSYTGIDLSARQIAANIEQWADIGPRLPAGCPAPKWIVGDAVDSQTVAPGSYDAILTCPPYADLERYSDDPRDLSTMSYPMFLTAYRTAIKRAAEMLKRDRFACIVVGEVRDPDGYCRGFVADTVAAFRDAGIRLYNEAVLIVPAGTAPVRAKQFAASRKLVRVHQSVLIFVKGDPKAATTACGDPGTYDGPGALPAWAGED